jgi:methyl-accepting chemotaxis protein
LTSISGDLFDGYEKILPKKSGSLPKNPVVFQSTFDFSEELGTLNEFQKNSSKKIRESSKKIHESSKKIRESSKKIRESSKSLEPFAGKSFTTFPRLVIILLFTITFLT